MDMAKVKRYRDLRREAKRNEDARKALTAEADKLEREILEAFVDAEVQSVQVDGSTVYLERKLWAQKETDPSTDEPVPTEVVVEALNAAGLGDFVQEGYNTNTLSAYLRDLDENEEPLPPALRGVIKAAEVFKIRYRKAGEKSAGTTKQPVTEPAITSEEAPEATLDQGDPTDG